MSQHQQTENPSPMGEIKASIRLLLTPRFGVFWSANFLSSIGTWTQSIAEPWLLLSLGASPFIIGLDNFAINGPVWFLILLGGRLADTGSRRAIITRFQSLQMLCPTIIAALLFLKVGINPFWIIGLSLIVGVTDALSMPSFQSIVPSLVPHKDIPRGLALNSTQFNLSRIVGPALAGLLLAQVGAFACFVVSAASYLPFIGAALWALPKSDADRKRRQARQPFLWQDLKGIGAVAPVRTALLRVLVVSMLCGPVVTFSLVLISQVFAGEAAQFSAAVGAFGIGGLLGGVALLGVSSLEALRRLSLVFSLAYGAVLVALSLTPYLWSVPLLMGAAGLCMALTNISSNSTIQSLVKPELLGQAASLFTLAMRGGLPLGSLATGLSAGYFGIQHTLLANGILALAGLTAIAIAGRK